MTEPVPTRHPVGPDRVAAWLGSKLAEDAATPVADVEIGPLTTPGVGQSNDTLLFDARWREGAARRRGSFVIRRQPTANQLFYEPDVLREYRVLRALEHGSDVPVPHVRWAEPDPSVLGAPFFVMTNVPGTVPSGKPSVHVVGWLPTLTPAQRRHLWESAMACLVAVHAVDWRRTHAFLLDGDPQEADLEAHLRRLERWYGWVTRGRPYAVTDAALAHLFEHWHDVDPGDPVLVWGDARIGNMIFGADLDVAAAIDWEVACIGAPALDLAHWLFFDEFATAGAGVQRLEGFPDRATTIARYEALSGRTVADLDYFGIVQGFFLATTLIRQADLAVDQGRLAEGTRMGHDNTVTQMLARWLGLPVPELAPDYLAHRQAPGGTRP